METLAELAAPSIPVSHRHFKAVTAHSPLQYQKHVRMLHERSFLIAGEGNATSVAFGVGSESPTQFSREYARQFGLPPPKDAARLRAHGQSRSRWLASENGSADAEGNRRCSAPSRSPNRPPSDNGGGRGIRTLGRALQPYDGLANRCLQPLGHPSARAPFLATGPPPCQWRCCRSGSPIGHRAAAAGRRGGFFEKMRLSPDVVSKLRINGR